MFPSLQDSKRRWQPVSRAHLSIILVNIMLIVITSNRPTNASAPSSIAPSSTLPLASSLPSASLLAAATQKLVISSQGINVPKRPAIIAGLNQQFNRVNSRAVSNSSSPIVAHNVGGILAAAVGLSSTNPFGYLVGVSNRIRQANTTVTAGNLYLDRHQQELLAANPTISTHLLTRSDTPSASSSNDNNYNQIGVGSFPLNNQKFGYAPHHNQQQTDGTSGGSGGVGSQQQQSYRGYSLIELEVKSEQDRRYVQDLYSNLSAALNEQAQRPNSFTVSPYVDIDFWSFKSDLNEQIDIMVSPKARPFILNQLSRARIKHRVKIDDMQTKLDQQQQIQSNLFAHLPAGSSASGSGGGELSGRQSFGSSSSSNAPGGGGNEQLNGRQEPKLDPLAGTASMNDSLFFENYQRLADINQYLESIVARARDIARVQVIGRSSQGRYLRVLRLGYEQSDLDGSTSPLMDARMDYQESAVAELDSSAELSGKLQPVQQNASTILEQFLRRQQSVKKVGSIWLDGGTHAREWISPATVLYLSFRLASNHAKCKRFFEYLRTTVSQHQLQQQLSMMARRADQAQIDSDLLNGINEINTSLLQGTISNGGYNAKPRPRTELEQMIELLAKRPQEVASEHACDLELEQLVRKYTFYIMPVLNPDGYEYSHTHNRLWRKTRSTSNHPIYRHFCLGADPNRNYDARHGSTGSSSHPCSQTYGGTTPFTEPETRHQSNFVYSHRDTLKMYISFHSYSQMILLPFSHSKQFAPDHKDLESVGQAAVKAIERTHGTQYRVGASAAILYTASGTASDWAYEKAGIKYSYTIELRDTGTYGFLLPRNQIIPTGEETFNGLLAMLAQMEKNDNLLTSKSSVLMTTGTNSTNSSSTAGFVHAPDMDQFRPFGRFRPKPAQLENALDGSDTWATPEPKVPGVRDRTPVSDDGGEGAPAAAADSNNRVVEEEIVSMSEEEPDAGLAFEGEGDLMEPTNNLSVNSALNGQSSEAAAESAAKLLGHIYAHSTADNYLQQKANGNNRQVELLGRQNQHQSAVRQRLASNQLGLSSNGRSLINHPPLPSRTTPGSPRRESSNERSA